MKPKTKKIISSALALLLALVFVTGASEVVGMLGGSPMTAEVLGSDGDYVPPTPVPTKKKKSNTLSAKGKTVNISAAKLVSKKQTVARKKAIKVSNAKGKVTYKKKSGNSKVSINKSTGKITVKKGLKKGIYKIKIQVKAAGNSDYKSGSKTVTVKIKVNKAGNTLDVDDKTITVNASDLTDDPFVIVAEGENQYASKGKGTVTYTNCKENDPIFTVDSATGNITVAAGTAAGTYELCVKVKAAGTSVYAAETDEATITVIIQ